MNIKRFLTQEEPYYNTESDIVEFIKKYNSKYKTLYYKKKTQEVLRLINFPIENKNILDIGCCAGYFSIGLAKKGGNITGIDSSEYAIAAAKHNAKLNNVECKFIKEDFNVAEFDDKFDLIIAKDVIEHIEEDVEFLKKIKSILKENGEVIIATQNSFSFNYFFEGAIRKLLGQKRWIGWDSTHLRWYSPWKLKRKFKAAGLKVEGFSSSYFFPYEMLKVLTKKSPRNKFYTLIDDNLGNKKPFSGMGWSISAKGRQV